MKIVYLTITILLIIGLIYWISNNDSNTANAEQAISSKQRADTIPEQSDKDNPYEGLRRMALNISPAQLQLTLPNDRKIVYGVVMDWNMNRGMATLTAFTTGDASLYFSSGGGMLGAGHSESVTTAAKSFISQAQNYLNNTNQTETTPLPNKNCVTFYFLTNKGKFSIQEQFENFENRTSNLMTLFEEGNKVISELRVLHENK